MVLLVPLGASNYIRLFSTSSLSVPAESCQRALSKYAVAGPYTRAQRYPQGTLLQEDSNRHGTLRSVYHPRMGACQSSPINLPYTMAKASYVRGAVQCRSQRGTGKNIRDFDSAATMNIQWHLCRTNWIADQENSVQSQLQASSNATAHALSSWTERWTCNKRESLYLLLGGAALRLNILKFDNHGHIELLRTAIHQRSIS